MTLSEDLVREARMLDAQSVGDRRATPGRIRREPSAPDSDEKERRIDATIAMLNDLYDRHGGLGEEFSSL